MSPLRLVQTSGDERPVDVRIAEAEKAWQEVQADVALVTPEVLMTMAAMHYPVKREPAR